MIRPNAKCQELAFQDGYVAHSLPGDGGNGLGQREGRILGGNPVQKRRRRVEPVDLLGFDDSVPRTI
jgi:hypothetical protein